ncbi:hypothetical protein FRB90_010352 [Tulasnella sp. 427]|nr:hypothetical protein FRB90_010352 [Tulasnella sp. 427]
MKSLQFLSLLHIVAHSTITLQTDSKSTPSHDTRCYYDPFYHLRLDAPPICSLSPKSGNADPTPDILSFEEWKAARQIAAEPMQKPHSDPDNALQHPNKSISDDDERTAPSVLDGAQSPGEDSAGGNAVQGTKDERVRVPLTDRLNYASQDCTARVHSSHKGGKSPSAILSSKKDRYMLSPCNYKNKFVVVELCDDVRIDTVQLANYEFFSGVFKDVKISLADSAPGDPLSWVDAGTYRAKNIRGVQSFHPQQGRQKFWRYIRIDFLSHYGNEYFCPVSLLRVYGLTHMEDYKWVGWQIEKEAPTVPQLVKMEEVVISATAQPEDNPTTVPLDVPSQLSSTKTWPFASSQHMAGFATMPHTAFSSNAHSAQIVLPLTSAAPSTTEGAIEAIRHGDEADFDGRPENPVDAPSAPLLDSSLKVEHSRRGLATQPGQERTGDSGDGPGNSLTSTISATPSASDALPARPSLLSSSASHSLPSSAVATPPTASIHTGGGESIYRMIMNRLHVLEINSTLGIRYVEEQTRSLRDVVRKLEEDVGRLDELEKRQQRLFERTVLEIEKQRRESDMEIRKLAADVQTLAREVTLEKRLGFLQLCLLICTI